MNNKMEIGTEIETTIVAINGDCVFLDMNAKSEGIADTADFLDKDGKLTVKEGDKVKVFFTGENHGEMHFSAKIGGDKADKTMIENAWKSGIPVEGKVESEIKGGYEIKIGESRAFCPYSQMGFKARETAEYYVGRVLTFMVTEYKNEGRNILVSNRAICEMEYNKNLQDLAEKIKVGDVVEGVVESVQNFGAFVTVEGFRTLLPVSEIQFDRVENIFDIISEGQKVRAQVLKTDWKNERVSISMKALIADPWSDIENRYSEGQKIDGKISRVADFGVFVNLESGIDGLVHISELEDVSKNTNLKKVYKTGDAMSVVIKSVDAKNKRISLRTASSVEQDKNAEKYMSSQSDDGDTYNPFAALLKK